MVSLMYGIGLVVAQENVEARLALLDEVVLKGQCLALVVDGDVFDIDSLAHERAGFRVGLGSVEKVRPHTGAQVLRLAHVDHLACGVLVEIAAGRGGERPNFVVEIHALS